MPKAIVVFSDGTGNSAAKLFKTNVWRMYQALDLRELTQAQIDEGAEQQIAYYDDGVGTSSFKPYALLGGAFGVGLRRNVLDLYRFICRNYKDGDRIYAFGFSRGAFTIRVLVGLVVTQGLVRYTTEDDLGRDSAAAYRAYRRRFGEKKIDGGKNQHIVKPIRDVRDRMRRMMGMRPYSSVSRLVPERIAFVGVWDTVSAYGLPLSVLTRGVDKYVWPMSMPNYVLSPKVAMACHALALDDERDTFHPLLWDEVEEQKLVEAGEVAAGRLKQVWFSGMHSNIGGGYPDDRLSHIPLYWMMREAEAAGLRFLPGAIGAVERDAQAPGPMHDSRRGLGGYYRYQPRKIGARIDPPEASTLIMRDPDLNDRGMLRSVKIHESVFKRIRSGEDGYAPLVLPAEYLVVRHDGSIVDPASGTTAAEAPVKAEHRAQRQELVWNDVWRRRVNYFATVGVSLALVGLAFANYFDPPQSACAGPQCVLTPVIEGVGAFLPGILESLVRALALSPGWVLLGAIAIWFLLGRGAKLQQRIQDGMRALWMESLNLGAAAGKSRGRFDDLIYRVRTGRAYLRFFQSLKWKIIPGAFGLFVLAVLTAAAVLVPVFVLYQGYVALASP